jgi:indole-3-glycerol phosphate synthase
LIAEVKKASPSKGVIRSDFQPVPLAQAYQAGGASCLSVLTDVDFFQGSLDYLSAIAKSVQLPLLRKDFIIHPYQVYEARAAGADAVLLIAECLEPEQLSSLYQLIRELGMAALIELYERKHLDAVLDTGTQLIGINNRDLTTFQVDLQHTIRLRGQIPSDRIVVGESGIHSRADALLLESNGIQAMLVGESLMRQDDVRAATSSLLGLET